MQYRLVLLDDQNKEIGVVTALDIHPSTLVVVMPESGSYFTAPQANNIARALEAVGVRVLVLDCPANFVRLERVDTEYEHPTTPFFQGRSMTRDEFEVYYAQNSGMTVEQLRAFNAEFGRDIRPCDCGDGLCRGWQMVNVRDYEEERPSRNIFDERMPELSPYERGVLMRFQDGYRRPTWKKRR